MWFVITSRASYAMHSRVDALLYALAIDITGRRARVVYCAGAQVQS